MGDDKVEEPTNPPKKTPNPDILEIHAPTRRFATRLVWYNFYEKILYTRSVTNRTPWKEPAEKILLTRTKSRQSVTQSSYIKFVSDC